MRLFLALGALMLLAGCSGARKDTRASPARRETGLQVSASEWQTNFARHTVPLSGFESGGPGKDGIPAIDNPTFETVAGTAYLTPREPVIELVVKGKARAYPIQILIWHEIVNDLVAGVPVAVTLCPLCNTALVFDRRVRGRRLDFGTTGNLRNSDLVMYDRQTETWWQQFGGAGVVGRYAGVRLRRVPGRIVAWSVFAHVASERLPPPLRGEPVPRLRRRVEPAVLHSRACRRRPAVAEGAGRLRRAQRQGGRRPAVRSRAPAFDRS